jgi:hypothetical protein
MKFFGLAALLSASASGFVSQKTTFVRTAALEATRRPFISGNWKLNPQTREDACQLASDISASITIDSPDADVAVFVPYVFIEASMNAIGNSKVTIGAEVCTQLTVLYWMLTTIMGLITLITHTYITTYYLHNRASVRRFKAPLPVPSRPTCCNPWVSSGMYTINFVRS